MRRKLIPNVPEIPYDGNNAAFFLTLLEAALRAMGEDCGRAKLIALSGEGNRFCWTDGAWAGGNETTESINKTPFETENRVLSAIGWRAEYIAVQRDRTGGFMNTNPAQIRRDFVSAIDSGFPILMRYVEHPDCDLNVFFGYEGDGERIIGYDYNSGFIPGAPSDSHRSAPVAWSDWEKNVAGYILLRGKSIAAPERDAALSAFQFAVEHARSAGEIRGRKVGFAAWRSFLEHLEHDDFSALALCAADVPAVDGVAYSVEHRFFIYCDALCQIDARKDPWYNPIASATGVKREK